MLKVAAAVHLLLVTPLNLETFGGGGFDQPVIMVTMMMMMTVMTMMTMTVMMMTMIVMMMTMREKPTNEARQGGEGVWTSEDTLGWDPGLRG